MIKVEQLTQIHARRDGEIRALDNVSFSAEAGRVLAIVGPSGSGKSTLLFALGMLATPTSGKVFIDGIPVYEQPHSVRLRMRREKVGFVFQTFHLLPCLTAVENIRAALYLRGWKRNDIKTEAERLLMEVGLSGRGDHISDDLSVGERQRVAMARAMAGNPRLLLADEPTGNLDPDARRLVYRHLGDFARNRGSLVIMVTHDSAVGDIADEVIHLKSGRIAM
ncbi:MAG: ABC transporter ATP-binding protein [Planctomycetota bacterium]